MSKETKGKSKEKHNRSETNHTHGTSAIKFENVSKAYNDGTVALDNINLDINHGDFIFLIGASGAGKTTLMNLIVKEEDPSQGEVVVLGDTLSKVKRGKVHEIRRKVGYIFQDFKLLESKNVFENVALSLEVSGGNEEKIRKVVPNLLHLVGLADKVNRLPGHLSGGEKQRLAIARALASEPKILLADEPTGNLDETSSWVVVDLIKKINDWGTTIIFGTHNMDIVKSLNKKVVKLDKGKIVQS